MGEARRRKLRELENEQKNVDDTVSFTGTIRGTIGMRIIKPHEVKSKRVKNYGEIENEVKKMKKLVDSEFTEGLFKEAYSLAHCEVSKTPYAFFVINSDFMKKKVFKHQVIINPRITNIPNKIKFEADKDKKEHDNNMSIQEACMQFPFRKPKKLDRPYRIEVEYQVPFFFGLFLRTIREEFEGLQSQIFQHNLEHIRGKNIFFKS